MKAALFLLLICAGCTEETMQDKKPIGMPNPASAHCVVMGGTLEIRSEPKGQVGYCHLPDGRVVEEWVLFRASQKS